jgi:hypothetical protein
MPYLRSHCPPRPHPPPALAHLAPAGAYEPRAFMKPQHTNPEDAVQIHRDVRSKRSMGIHCCTFFLTLGAVEDAKCSGPARRGGGGCSSWR